MASRTSVQNKDGYIWMNTENPALRTDGWADVAAGLKYNVLRSPETQTLLSAGLTYELDVGTHRVFHGRGDGEFHMFLTGVQELFPGAHWISASGFRIPVDHNSRSQMWYWSNHWDYEFLDNLYGLVELNWFHWTRSGEALAFDFEGGDLFNLGASDVAGNDILTMGVGSRYRLPGGSELGVGYEFPLTDRRDILASRLYVDFAWRY